MKLLIFFSILAFSIQTTEIASAQWTQVNGTTLHIQCLAASNMNIYAGNGTVVFSTDNGLVWNFPLHGPRGSSTRAIIIIDTFIFAGTDGGWVYRSADSGANWSKVNSGLTDSKDRFIWGFGANRTTLFALSQFGGAASSSDFGENWVKSDSGLYSDTSSVNTRVYTIIGSSTNLFAGTSNGVFLSTDGGASWTLANNNLKNIGISAFVRNESFIYAGTNKGIFRSADEGNNWTQINNGLTNTSVQAVVVSGATLFAATAGVGGGIYRSSDSGAHWIFMSKDLADSNITALAVNDKYLFAGTNSTGIWRYPLSALSKVEQNSPNSDGIIFHPNYPNPFSTQTTISFSISKRVFIDMKIFDLLGKECAHVFSGELDAGDHSYAWNTSHLPSGVYTCIIRAADGSAAEQPIIVR